MRKLIITALIGFSSMAFGQQVPQFSQYLRNQYMVNPGAAGVYDFLDITAGGRLQWLGFEDAPKTSYLYASSPVSAKPRLKYNPALRVSNGPIRNPKIKTGKLKHVVGGMVMIDQYGAFRQLKFAGTYALHIPVTKKFNLSLGVNLGVSNRAFLKDRAQTLNLFTGTATDNTYDTYASQGDNNTMDLDAGLYFYSDKFFLGLSAEQLTGDLVAFGADPANFSPEIHTKATIGYKFKVSDNVTLMPAMLVKYLNPAPVSIEGSLQLEYKEWLWFAVSYRNTDAIVAMAGLNISKRFKFGYSYDYNVSRFNEHSSGGHELVLGLMLGR